MKIFLFAALALLSAQFSAFAVTAKFCYLIPSDKANIAEAAIGRAALDLQAWAKNQMGGKTFQLDTPIVTVWYSQHDSEWFREHPIGDEHRGYYWLNTLEEAYSFGASWTDGNSYVIYNAAEIAPDQYAGGTGHYGGFAVLADRDLRALLGQDPEWTVCREIGGLGHEFLHTRGLPHPDGDPNFGIAIMGTGYLIYPACILLQQEKDYLDLDPLFIDGIYAIGTGPCFVEYHRPAPAPKPRTRPTPRPRP